MAYSAQAARESLLALGRLTGAQFDALPDLPTPGITPIHDARRYRRDSVFGGIGHALERITPAAIATLVQEARDIYTVKYKRKGDRAGPVTHLHIQIYEALLNCLSKTGHAFPSYDHLMEAVSCCRQTVSVALKRLRELGLITWKRRLTRRGGSTRQTSNLYSFPRWNAVRLHQAKVRHTKTPARLPEPVFHDTRPRPTIRKFPRPIWQVYWSDCNKEQRSKSSSERGFQWMTERLATASPQPS